MLNYLLLALLFSNESGFTATSRLGTAASLVVEAIGRLDLASVLPHTHRLSTAAILHITRLRLLGRSNLGQFSFVTLRGFAIIQLLSL